MTRRAFLICPVRGVDPSLTKGIVQRLEQSGWTMHWPPRDTDQADDTGLRICEDNRKAIAASDVVYVVWDGISQGCLFDLGMAFALHKPVVVVQLPPETEGKSFQNMVRAWAELIPTEPIGHFTYKKICESTLAVEDEVPFSVCKVCGAYGEELPVRLAHAPDCHLMENTIIEIADGSGKHYHYGTVKPGRRLGDPIEFEPDKAWCSLGNSIETCNRGNVK